MNTHLVLGNRFALAFTITIFGTAAALFAAAPPNVPVYSNTYGDAVTGDNQFLGADGKLHYDVDAGADQYQFEMYERPTSQTFTYVTPSGGGPAKFSTTGDYW